MANIKLGNFASKLRHQITLLEDINQDERAESIWHEKYQVYAEIKPLNQYNYKTIENFNFDHVMTESLYIFKIRFIENLSINLRLKYKNRYFEIKRVINQDEKNIISILIVLEL